MRCSPRGSVHETQNTACVGERTAGGGMVVLRPLTFLEYRTLRRRKAASQPRPRAGIEPMESRVVLGFYTTIFAILVALGISASGVPFVPSLALAAGAGAVAYRMLAARVSFVNGA